jgi:hypothetical protein
MVSCIMYGHHVLNLSDQPTRTSRIDELQRTVGRRVKLPAGPGRTFSQREKRRQDLKTRILLLLLPLARL